MYRLGILLLLTFIFLLSLTCSNTKSRELLKYKAFSYKTVAINNDTHQNHTIYIEGFDPKEIENIIDLANLLACYSKSSYLIEGSKFYHPQSGKSVAEQNLPIGRIFIVSKWTDDFNYLSTKKRIASLDVTLTDKIELKIYNNDFTKGQRASG